MSNTRRRRKQSKLPFIWLCIIIVVESTLIMSGDYFQNEDFHLFLMVVVPPLAIIPYRRQNREIHYRNKFIRERNAEMERAARKKASEEYEEEDYDN